MIENSELQKTIDNLGLSKNDYLFLTIKTVYLYHMKSGDKNVEYREPSDFIFTRLYDNYSKNKFSKPKNISHILFQAGYNPDSPRMLIELKGWNYKGKNTPQNVNTKGMKQMIILSIFYWEIFSMKIQICLEKKSFPKKKKEQSPPRINPQNLKQSYNQNSLFVDPKLATPVIEKNKKKESKGIRPGKMR